MILIKFLTSFQKDPKSNEVKMQINFQGMPKYCFVDDGVFGYDKQDNILMFEYFLLRNLDAHIFRINCWNAC